MRVLAVFPDLHDSNAGGVQVSGQLAWEMLQRETEARALIPNKRLNLFAALRAASFQPDLILFWHIDLLRVAPFIRSRAPRVLFLHGIEVWRKHGWLKHQLLRRTRFIANSNYTLQRAIPFMPQLRDADTQIVQLGLGAPRARSEPLAGVRAAIMIARIDATERYKGHHEVIRAWPQVAKAVAGAQLWIVGEGSLRAELETLVIELGLGDVVRFYGRVSENEKHTLLDAARCLVLPSRAEGFGLVYVEAMRAGRPCLAGIDAGVEVINPPDAGLAVDPADTTALVEALVTLLVDDKQWQAQSTAARARYEAQFTAVLFQQRLLDALKRIH